MCFNNYVKKYILSASFCTFVAISRDSIVQETYSHFPRNSVILLIHNKQKTEKLFTVSIHDLRKTEEFFNCANIKYVLKTKELFNCVKT